MVGINIDICMPARYKEIGHIRSTTTVNLLPSGVQDVSHKSGSEWMKKICELYKKIVKGAVQMSVVNQGIMADNILYISGHERLKM